MGKIIPILENMKIKINWNTSEFITENNYISVFSLPEKLKDKYGEKVIIDAVLYITAKEVGDYKLFAAWSLFRERNRIKATPSVYREISSYPHRVAIKKNPDGWEMEKCRGLLYAEQFKEDIIVIKPPSDPIARERLRVKIEGVRVSRGKRYGGLAKKIGAKRLHPWVYAMPGFKIPKLEKVVRKHGGKIIY